MPTIEIVGLADPSETAPVYTASASSRLALRSVFYHYLLGWSWDRVASSNRMRLSTDMIHLSRQAGEMVIDQVEGVIRSDA